MQVYLDNAATTPLHADVLSAMTRFLERHFGNPSSTHAKGREAKVELEKARKKLVSIIGCKEKELIFTSGGTEANNAVLKSLASNGQIKRIISSPIEHHSILDTLEWVKENTSVKVVFLEVNEEGAIELSQLEKLLQQQVPTLVTLMHANNEIGTILPLQKVGELCKSYQALFHSDMVQTLGHLPLNLSDLPLDFASGSAHKTHGPKGVGFIFINSKNAKLSTFMHGGAQERGLRGGTENIAGIIGMAKAYETSKNTIEEDLQHILSLKALFVRQIKKYMPSIEFNGNSQNQTGNLPNVINIKIPGDKNDTLLFNLDMKGVYVSEGSACSSGAIEGSHVLAAISNNKNISNNLRISFSKYTTPNEVEYAIQQIEQAVNLD